MGQRSELDGEAGERHLNYPNTYTQTSLFIDGGRVQMAYESTERSCEDSEVKERLGGKLCGPSISARLSLAAQEIAICKMLYYY